MKRMSNLPSLEFCGKADSLAVGVETSNSFRSTCFHKYCETGQWPAETKRLSLQDLDEIKRWKVPTPLWVDLGSVKIRLDYKDAVKERLLVLDNNFAVLALDNDLSQDCLEKNPDILTAGHLDMAWDVPEHDLVVISDIKSSIFAVKDRCDSLQLHAYGMTYAKQCGRSRYLPCIWDASEGKHYIGTIVESDSFAYEEVKERIRIAATNNSDKFTKGTHCSGCWKRDSCPAHLVDLQDDHRFAKLFNGTATEADVREGIIAAKGLGELANKVTEFCKQWAAQHGGVRSEDGRKVWKPIERAGKSSLNTDYLISDLGLKDLSKYMKKGQPYIAYDWKLVK